MRLSRTHRLMAVLVTSVALPVLSIAIGHAQSTGQPYTGCIGPDIDPPYTTQLFRVAPGWSPAGGELLGFLAAGHLEHPWRRGAARRQWRHR